MLTPIFRALQQMDDPVFLGVLARSLAWSVLAFLGLLAGSAWAMQHVVGQPGWLGWAAGIAGGVGAALLAVWLFVPAAVLIATLYVDRVALAVDRRFYPGLPLPHGGAPLTVQVWDGIALGAQVLAWQVVALLLALALPGVGLLLGWAVTGWAIGRGLFVAVAMRRMRRSEALLVYAGRRGAVVALGLGLALAGTVPLLNLLVPVLGVAALTHVLNGAGHGAGAVRLKGIPSLAPMLGHRHRPSRTFAPRTCSGPRAVAAPQRGGGSACSSAVNQKTCRACRRHHRPKAPARPMAARRPIRPHHHAAPSPEWVFPRSALPPHQPPRRLLPWADPRFPLPRRRRRRSRPPAWPAPSPAACPPRPAPA